MADELAIKSSEPLPTQQLAIKSSDPLRGASEATGLSRETQDPVSRAIDTGINYLGGAVAGAGKELLSTVGGATELIGEGINKLGARWPGGGGEMVPREGLEGEKQALQSATADSGLPGETAGRVGEQGAEWYAGDAELKALAKLGKVFKYAPDLLKLTKKYPVITKLLVGSAKGAVVGGTQAGVKATAEGRDPRAAAVAGAEGGAVGGAGGELLEAATGGELAQKFINKSLGATPKDVMRGNPAKALLDEGIISPRTGSLAKYQEAIKAGKSQQEAFESAGGRMEAVNEKLNELKPQLDKILTASPAKISVIKTILDPLTEASVEVANNAMIQPEVAKAAELALDAWKDRIKTLVGIKDVDAMTAVELKRQLSATMNFTKNAAVDDVVEEVANRIYGNLKNAVHSGVPEAGPLDERMSNLMSAWSKLSPSKPGTLPAQELAGKGPGITGGNMWDIPQRVIVEIGKILTAAHAVTKQPVVKAALGLAGERGMVMFEASDGSRHSVPSDQLDAAKKIDPELKVIQ